MCVRAKLKSISVEREVLPATDLFISRFLLKTKRRRPKDQEETPPATRIQVEPEEKYREASARETMVKETVAKETMARETVPQKTVLREGIIRALFPLIKIRTKEKILELSVQEEAARMADATAVYLKWSRVPEAQRYVISGRVYGRGKYVTVKTLTRGTAVSTKITRLKKGAAIKSGTAYQFRVTAQKKVNGKWVSSKTASLIVRTLPKAPVITGVSSGKKTIKVKWRKVTGANGYQIYLSQKSKSGFRRVATLKRGSTVSKTLKRLKSGKRYYVKIRSFKQVRGKTVYSSFSRVKRIRVK